MSNPLHVAFIGLGQHARILSKALPKHFQIAACYSPDAAEVAEFAAAHHCQAHSNLEDICRDPLIDAALVISPNHAHAEQCIALANAKKHLFVEKPLCNTLEDVDAVREACLRNNVLLAVGHQERRHLVYRKIKQLIETGILGSVYSFEANHCGNLLDCWPQDDWRFENQYGTGPLLHKGIHKIDILNYLFGMPETITTLATQLEFNDKMQETTVSAVSYANKMVGSLSSSFRYTNASLNIYAEHHSIAYTGYGSIIRIKNERSWDVEEINCGDNNPYTEEFDEFSAAIRGNATVEVDGQAAYDAILFAIAAEESAHTNKKVHFKDLTQTVV